MVLGTGIAVATALGAYYYLTNKRECDAKLKSWIEEISDTQMESENSNESQPYVPIRSDPAWGRENDDSGSKKRAKHVRKPARSSAREDADNQSSDEGKDSKSESCKSRKNGSEKHVHLHTKVAKDIVRKLRHAEKAIMKGSSKAEVRVDQQPQLASYPYVYPQNPPLIYPNGQVVYQQPNMQPNMMMPAMPPNHPSSPIVWTAVQMVPGSAPPDVVNNQPEERKPKKKSKRSKKKKSIRDDDSPKNKKKTGKKKHSKKKSELEAEQAGENEKKDKKKKKSKRKSKHSKKESLLKEENKEMEEKPAKPNE